MNLYLRATTKLKDMIIDYIEIELVTGENVSLNWDESNVKRLEGGFSAFYKGICFGEERADGKLDDLRGMQIIQIGVYTQAGFASDISIMEMEFEENDSFYSPECLPYITNTQECDLT